MSKRSKLETGVPWIELTTTAADWKQAAPELLATMLGDVIAGRGLHKDWIFHGGTAWLVGWWNDGA